MILAISPGWETGPQGDPDLGAVLVRADDRQDGQQEQHESETGRQVKV